MSTTPLFWLPDTDAMARFGQALADTQPAVAVVHLQGDLGAGKSTLARAWLRALGVTGTIRSPTYTLVERYPLPARDGEAVHLDLYRIAAPDELAFLGLDDVPAVLWLVEWPDRGVGALPPADLVLELAVAGSGRTVHVSGPMQGWAAAAAQLAGLRAFPEP